MRRRAVFMLLTAFVMAGSAVILARGWLERQVPQVVATSAPAQPAMTTVVVAKVPLRFGDELNRQNLGTINWPADAAPAEGFASVDDVLSDKERRVALRDIGVNELVLKGRVSGFGGRATLSALVGAEMRAITVRVNDVQGVAGFVLPGERVDVIFTRPADAGSGSNSHSPPITDLLLQNVKVLAVDQIADNLKDKPVIVKAVTLEVSTEDAQKLTLAAQVGTLSLALRSFGNTSLAYTDTVTVNSLLARPTQIAAVPEAAPAAAVVRPSRQAHNIRIFRGTDGSEQEVVREAKPAMPMPQPATRRDAAAGRTAVSWTER